MSNIIHELLSAGNFTTIPNVLLYELGADCAIGLMQIISTYTGTIKNQNKKKFVVEIDGVDYVAIDYKYLYKNFKMTEPTKIKHIKKLVELGLIKKEKRAIPCIGPRLVNLYFPDTKAIINLIENYNTTKINAQNNDENDSCITKKTFVIQQKNFKSIDNNKNIHSISKDIHLEKNSSSGFELNPVSPIESKDKSIQHILQKVLPKFGMSVRIPKDGKTTKTLENICLFLQGLKNGTLKDSRIFDFDTEWKNRNNIRLPKKMSSKQFIEFVTNALQQEKQSRQPGYSREGTPRMSFSTFVYNPKYKKSWLLLYGLKKAKRHDDFVADTHKNKIISVSARDELQKAYNYTSDDFRKRSDHQMQFWASAVRLQNWINTQGPMLSKYHDLHNLGTFGAHLGSFEKLLDTFFDYLKSTGQTVPQVIGHFGSLPTPDRKNNVWSNFCRWLQSHFNLELQLKPEDLKNLDTELEKKKKQKAAEKIEQRILAREQFYCDQYNERNLPWPDDLHERARKSVLEEIEEESRER